jgi:MFS transporter, DHA1 family, multidrug resistance protein
MPTAPKSLTSCPEAGPTPDLAPQAAHAGGTPGSTKVSRRRIGFIVGALSALGPFSIDTYFPSFPALAAHFGVSEIQVQSTLSFYLVALAGMNLFHGALSDSFGRRRVILISLSVYAVSAAACVVAPSFGWLLGLRVVQGLAAGAGMIVSRAVIRDCFAGAEAQKFMAQVAMVAGLGPVLAPIVGGWLHVGFGWRGPFVFLGLLGVLLWWMCHWALPESLPRHLRQSFHPARLLRSYTEAVCHHTFVLLCLAVAFGGGGFLLYVATAPDVAINILGLSETQFGWLFVPIVAGLILGSALSGRLAGRIAPGRMVSCGFGLMGLGSALNLAVSAWLTPRVPWAVLPLTVYTFGFSLVAPVITIQSLDVFPQRRGLASSLQGFAHILIFALIAGLGAQLVYRSAFKHATGMVLLMALSWLAYRGSQKFNTPKPPADGSASSDKLLNAEARLATLSEEL